MHRTAWPRVYVHTEIQPCFSSGAFFFLLETFANVWKPVLLSGYFSKLNVTVTRPNLVTVIRSNCCLHRDDQGQVVKDIVKDMMKLAHVPVQVWHGFDPEAMFKNDSQH